MGILASIKAVARSVVPQKMLDARRARAVIAFERQYQGKTNAQIFSHIYESGEWGSREGDPFYSGTGSHEHELVKPYVLAITAFLESLPKPMRAVDLGCGDFNVGRQVRPLCSEYVGCDVVPALIERNIAKFGGDFRCLDIVEDAIPDGDIVFIRQVLQHLDNAGVARVVPKLSAFRYVVLTEHVPVVEFVPNRDKPAGSGIRLSLPSGIVVTRTPFDFKVTSERVICEVAEGGGVIRTTVYEPG